MDSRTHHRLGLALRSERALGLRSVKTGTLDLPSVVEPAEVEAKPVEMVEVAPRVAPRQPPPRPPVRVAAPFPVAPVLFSSSSVQMTVSANAAPFSSPPLSIEEKNIQLQAMNDNEVKGCPKCRLRQTRTHTVFGEGDPDAKIFFIGEGPGENEDLTGRPFVGKAGQLLDRMIAGMGLKREQVFIANIVKCRPPENRVPMNDEVVACTPYLERQLEIIRPRVIVTLGLPSAKYMIGDAKLTMGKTRGNWFSYRGIKLMPTFHPSYVLRSYTEETRAAVWSDLKQVLLELGLPVPSRGK